jgi:V/A-type H+-transporting ATPase subunit I
MALLNMKKLALVAHADNKNAVLKALQDISAVEIISTDLEQLNPADASATIALWEAKLSQVRESLEFIKRYDDSKTSLLTPLPPVSKNEFGSIKDRLSEADSAIAAIKQFSEDMNSIKSRRQRIVTRISQLEPYANFDAPLESVKDTEYTSSLLGSVPSDNLDRYQAIKQEFGELAYFETFCENKDGLFIWVVMHKDIHEKLTGELKYINFTEAYTKDLFGTPKDILRDLKNRCAALEKEAAEYEEKAKKFIDYKQLLMLLEDYLVNEIEREKCIERLGQTGSAFVLEGWIIAEDQRKVEKALLEAAPEAYLALRDPEEGETPPTAVRNPKVVEPFEAVTDMYAVPSPTGYDPNVLMSIFYFIIFGMMIGDAAYGVILSLGAFLVLKLKKPSGMFRKITTVLMICGISTVIWGLIFGTVFSIPSVSNIALINTNTDPIMLLVLCIGIGILHIYAGIIVGMYMDIKRGHILAAIFDRFSWILLLTGVILLLIGSGLANIGQYLALAGGAILLFTQGRSKKGVVRKITGGLASLYGITGYISDILSYCRIFGMGLATTVIAQVFNTIAGMLMGGAVGYIFGIVILTVGHTFNIAINVLGAFVHTARLQYIEFFNKFYEGGGRAFKPLAIRTKNHRLTS